MLAPYGLAGVLTGASYRSSTDHTTRKLMDEWRQYYPVECSSNNGPTAAGQQQRGPGPGGGLEPASESEDMVEVIVGNVRMRYPTCYVMVCDADSAVNSAAFNQLATSEGGDVDCIASFDCKLNLYFCLSRNANDSTGVTATDNESSEFDSQY